MLKKNLICLELQFIIFATKDPFKKDDVQQKTIVGIFSFIICQKSFAYAFC